MSGKVADKVARQQVKESANWRCQNPACQQECLRPGESLSDFVKRLGRLRLCDVTGDRAQELETTYDSTQPFIMKAVSDGNGGYLALCGSCAIKFVQPFPQHSFVQTKLELLGQLRLL